jgi:hypothetical protein
MRMAVVVLMDLVSLIDLSTGLSRIEVDISPDTFV